MSTSTSASITGSEKDRRGLPRVNYKLPVVMTLLAALVLSLTLLGLAFLGVLNTITQINSASQHLPGASTFGGAICGVLSLLALAGAVYFLLAVLNGFRDLTGKLDFTRGAVVVRPGVQARNARNWLMLEPTYVGNDIEAASSINDEQAVASTDRSQIFNPRSTGRARHGPVDEDLKQKLDRTERTTGGSYLNPARIAANQPIPELESSRSPAARVVFRIDFAHKAGIVPGEDVLVAHSRFLRHIYYIARLRDGEWVPFRNRSLI